MRLVHLAVVALAVTTPAASGSVDSCRTGPDVGPPMDFSVVRADQSGEVPALRADSVTAGQVVLRGGIGTPVPCYGIAAGLTQRDSTLTVTLVATAEPVVCIQVPAVFEYRARIYGLSAGNYTVEVVATYPGTGVGQRTETVDVEIP